MAGAANRLDGTVSPRAVQLAITTASLVVLAGLVLPGVRLWRQAELRREAEADMARIASGITRFIEDTGVPPTLSRDGDPGGVFRLVGPGLLSAGAYFFMDRHQSGLQDHLVENSPRGRRHPGYPGWNGPYVSPLTPDPWGFAYVLVAYPLSREDDRDCVLVSGGPNGQMDGTYASPRDVIAAGDDLVRVILDKTPSNPGPIR
jgi:hypothetical protein